MELLIYVMLSVWRLTTCYDFSQRQRNPCLWAQAITGVENELQWYVGTALSIYQWCVWAHTKCHALKSVIFSVSCLWNGSVGEVHGRSAHRNSQIDLTWPGRSTINDYEIRHGRKQLLRHMIPSPDKRDSGEDTSDDFFFCPAAVRWSFLESLEQAGNILAVNQNKLPHYIL